VLLRDHERREAGVELALLALDLQFFAFLGFPIPVGNQSSIPSYPSQPASSTFAGRPSTSPDADPRPGSCPTKLSA